MHRRRLVWLSIPILTICLALIAHAAKPSTSPTTGRGKRGGTTTKAVQQFVQKEKDPNSPRKSQLHSKKPDNEIIRIDIDHDGDPDILEQWWNNKRVRWIDENDDMKPTDARGDMSMDVVQIDPMATVTTTGRKTSTSSGPTMTATAAPICRSSPPTPPPTRPASAPARRTG